MLIYLNARLSNHGDESVVYSTSFVAVLHLLLFLHDEGLVICTQRGHLTSSRHSSLP